MTNHNTHLQESGSPQKTIFDFASEGGNYDTLPADARKEVLLADKDKDSRDAFAEIRADQLFAQAAGVLVELMDSDEAKIRLGAACEVFRFRAVTLKGNKKRQSIEKLIAALDDGFRFR